MIKPGDIVFEDGIKLKVTGLHTNSIGTTIVAYAGDDCEGACVDSEWLNKHEDS